MNNSHIPVLLDKMIEYLDPKEGERYLDLTFGAGGYSRSILEKANCYVTAFDRDPNVKEFVEAVYKDHKDHFRFIQSEFSKITEFVESNSFDGIVADFGISSMQVDNAERGFSFSKKAKLDMRMSPYTISAFEVINNFSEPDIANIIFQYGGERDSRKIARYIISERSKEPIEDTIRLAHIVRRAKKIPYSKIDPATKTFQAIRIFVNNEIEEIETLLKQIAPILKIGGRIISVSFHELEDRLIKNYLRDNEVKKLSTSKYKQEFSQDGIYNLLTKKGVRPSDQEVSHNPRSRSAILRAAVKVRN